MPGVGLKEIQILSDHSSFKNNKSLHSTLVKANMPPTKSLWSAKVNEIKGMEDLTATPHNTEEIFRSTWRPWQYFVYTDAYLKTDPCNLSNPFSPHFFLLRRTFCPLPTLPCFFLLRLCPLLFSTPISIVSLWLPLILCLGHKLQYSLPIIGLQLSRNQTCLVWDSPASKVIAPSGSMMVYKIH